MRDTELISMVFTIGLPVLLAYLLMALRLFEVRYYKTNDKYSSNSKKISENTFGISIRDAALVTLALDISELLNNYTASLQEISSSLSRDLILITLLLFFHVTLLFFGLSYKRREYYENSKFEIPENMSLIRDVWQTALEKSWGGTS